MAESLKNEQQQEEEERAKIVAVFQKSVNRYLSGHTYMTVSSPIY